MKRAKNRDLVEIDYVGSTEDGVIFDTSLGVEADFEGVIDDTREYKPIKCMIGAHEILNVIEEALIGMVEGESKTIRVTPDKGYGEHDDKKLKEVHHDLLKRRGQTPIVGQQMVLTDRMSRAIPGRVIKVEEDKILVDFNHPLAGKVLIFTIKLLRICDGSKDHS